MGGVVDAVEDGGMECDEGRKNVLGSKAAGPVVVVVADVAADEGRERSALPVLPVEGVAERGAVVELVDEGDPSSIRGKCRLMRWIAAWILPERI